VPVLCVGCQHHHGRLKLSDFPTGTGTTSRRTSNALPATRFSGSILGWTGARSSTSRWAFRASPSRLKVPSCQPLLNLLGLLLRQFLSQTVIVQLGRPLALSIVNHPVSASLSNEEPWLYRCRVIHRKLPQQYERRNIFLSIALGIRCFCELAHTPNASCAPLRSNRHRRRLMKISGPRITDCIERGSAVRTTVVHEPFEILMDLIANAIPNCRQKLLRSLVGVMIVLARTESIIRPGSDQDSRAM
jgi:hypothetical protein